MKNKIYINISLTFICYFIKIILLTNLGNPLLRPSKSTQALHILLLDI